MSACFYLEVYPEESWEQITRLLSEFLRRYENIEGFGVMRAESIALHAQTGSCLMGFRVRDGFALDADAFSQWAATLRRRSGVVRDGNLCLSDGETICLREQPPVQGAPVYPLSV